MVVVTWAGRGGPTIPLLFPRLWKRGHGDVPGDSGGPRERARAGPASCYSVVPAPCRCAPASRSRPGKNPPRVPMWAMLSPATPRGVQLEGTELSRQARARREPLWPRLVSADPTGPVGHTQAPRCPGGRTPQERPALVAPSPRLGSGAGWQVGERSPSASVLATVPSPASTPVFTGVK